MMNWDKVEVIGGWVMLVGSAILWPVSQLTFAKGEPPVTLGLSWLAITLVALDYLKSSRMHQDQEEESHDHQ
jgi:hypothetical protein